MVAWLDYGLPVAVPAVANRARDTGVCPVPELTSSCVGSPRTLRASVRRHRRAFGRSLVRLPFIC